MDIKDILNKLGLDLTDPETRRGAIEAIDAILASRTPAPIAGAGSGLGGQDIEVELDPDLIMPSQKQQPQPDNDEDIDIEDEEDILSQIKQNQSEQNNAGADPETDDRNSSQTPSENNSSDNNDTPEDPDASSSDNSDNTNESEKAQEDEEEEDEESDEKEEPDTVDGEDSLETTGDSSETARDDTDSETIEQESGEEDSDIEDIEAPDEEDTDDADFDEEDFLDDELKDKFDDESVNKKYDSRKIKRERTLRAAEAALTAAKARKAPNALIHELEKAIEALQALTEAAGKNLKDLSDDEFNLMINRVFDAISALGDSDLTFSTEEERNAKAQEIKTDLSSSKTQTELSAEDTAKIRAEHQAIKAREKEADKYKKRGASSFKGFQDFLSSLYRAIALQVTTQEEQDNTWSAINRRYSGTGVLQQGKKINELSSKKIPVIDFYFDQSGSWNASDIKIGEKAVEALADMEDKGQIKINVYYFANKVHTDAASARVERGTEAWNEIIKNIITTQATNVVIMTDGDMEDWWEGSWRDEKALTHTTPGYVWYLWRDGENAPRLPRDLKGRGGTQQFAFSRDSI